jgi:hypothetical protein
MVYRRIEFTPLPTLPDILNYWVGPSESNPNGNCEILFNYLEEIICNGDSHAIRYLESFLAHMIQMPEVKPGVMIVLLGGQGTGKGMFFNLLRAIWRRTTLQVTNVEEVVGRFNASLERNFVVCMDEALFAGDRKSLDRLKSMITDPFFNIEQKHQPSRTIGSVHRFFAASNHEHFANIDRDDRRFVFLEVSDAHQQDISYFSKISAAINDPSVVGNFIHILKSRSLTSFEPRVKPNNEAGLRQKLMSLTGFERYWYEVLLTEKFEATYTEGTVGGLSIETMWSSAMFIPTIDLIGHFTQYDRNAQRHLTAQTSEVHRLVKRLCPSAVATRQTHQASILSPNATKRGLLLPDLKTARNEFEQAIRGKVDWG